MHLIPFTRRIFRKCEVGRQLRRTSGGRKKELSLQEIQELAQISPTPLSLQQMKSFACDSPKLRLVSATFLHKELQIRFARAFVELSDLPMGMNEMPSIKKAIALYRDELNAIHLMEPPNTAEKDLAFTTFLDKSKTKGNNLVPLICGGLKELEETDLGSSAMKLLSFQEDLNQRLDTFFISRIGIRMLVGQHVKSLKKVGGRVELLNVEEIVKDASQRAARLCKKYCGQVPEVQINATASAASPFTYVESHLHHMIFELVKNSMRATVEYHENSQRKVNRPVNTLDPVMDPSSKHLGFVLPDIEDVTGVTIYPDVGKYRRFGKLPPVQIVICQGQEDLTIKISDEGGGVQRSIWPKMWHWGYSTSPPYPPKDSYGHHSFRQHFSGGGYGLPIARLFARYFGGEITFISLEGFGSSAFIQAHRLGKKTELVPGHATFSLQPLYI